MKTFCENENVIAIEGSISTFEIYCDFLDILNQYMISELNTSKGYRKPPIISLEKVNWIDAHAIPILLSIGTFLKQYYKESTEIRLPYNPRVISYLKVSRFFDYVGYFENNIFKYDRDLLGLDFNYKKPPNQEYIVDRLAPTENYYNLSEGEQIELKYFISDKLKDYSVPRLTKNLFPKNEEEARKSETDSYIFSHLNDLYEAIAEIMCNATLYTNSYSYVCIQKLSRNTNYPGIYLSISDSGRGFRESLSLRPQKNICMSDMLDNELLNIIKDDSPKVLSKLDDFFSIFEALYTSASNERFNLWRLITFVISSSGIIRVHNNKTQLVFNMNNKCFYCKYQRRLIKREMNSFGSSRIYSKKETSTDRQEEVIRCMNCMVRNYTSDKRLSQLRLFTAKLQGVHIEIDFPC